MLVWHSQTPEWFFHEDYDKNKAYADAAIEEDGKDTHEILRELARIYEHM